MFSVVIPLYNKEANIRQTLESVLNQTFTDFEIVIVNDGSKDNSRDVVLSMDDARIRLIDQENAGVSAARNRGIKEARGEWIAFLDADDLWKPNKLEEVARAIQNNGKITWLVSGLETRQGKRRKKFLYSKSRFLEDALDDLLNGLYIQTSSVVVKRKLFLDDTNLLFRAGVNNSEDREVWYKLMFKYPRLFYLQQVLAVYVRDDGGNSLTSSPSKRMHFIDLQSRLKDDIELLEKSRQDKILRFLYKFNRRALWYRWVRNGWDDLYGEYVNASDRIIMKQMQVLPPSLRLIIMKAVIR